MASEITVEAITLNVFEILKYSFDKKKNKNILLRYKYTNTNIYTIEICQMSTKIKILQMRREKKEKEFENIEMTSNIIQIYVIYMKDLRLMRLNVRGHLSHSKLKHAWACKNHDHFRLIRLTSLPRSKCSN